MAEALKHLLDPPLVRWAAGHFARQAAALGMTFDEVGFVAAALPGLETLELKPRAMQIADALQAALPGAFDDAATLIEATLAPPAQTEDLGELRLSPAGLGGWILWPVGEVLARSGIGDPDRALRALHALTQRFTAEFAIRPLIAAHPQRVFETLARWVDDPNLHVRRLVSEGSRPRLPWGMQLKALIADPSPTLPLLRALQDDPSGYVRRSVANHLNDIAKDHPHRVADWLEQYLPGAPEPRRALLRHASRTLVKRGDARVLAAWGLGARYRGDATLTLQPARVTLGGAVQIALDLRSRSRQPQALAIDYAVHHVKADGRTVPKVFKGWQITLGPGQTRQLARRHAVRPITTRTYHPGRHRVVVQINGQPVAEAAFTLRV